MNRRDFIETAALSAMAAGLSAQYAHGAGAPTTGRKEMPLELKDGDIVLFQGDSITDAGRVPQGPEGMGNGYALLTSAWISAAHPERKIQFINRGISGNRVIDLQGRWKVDCLDLKPAWVSILIGVNDTWRRYDSNDLTTADSFEGGYRDILNQVRDQLKAKIILMEPFLLHISDKIKEMREDLDQKIEVVHRLAKDYNAKLVPLDQLFQEACKYREPVFWAGDGVHPTWPGHALMTQAWIEAVKG